MSDKIRYDVYEARCIACDTTAPCRNLNLYTIGSEGTTLCQPCQIKVTEFVRGMMSEHMTAKMAVHKAKRNKTGGTQ